MVDLTGKTVVKHYITNQLTITLCRMIFFVESFNCITKRNDVSVFIRNAVLLMFLHLR